MASQGEMKREGEGGAMSDGEEFAMCEKYADMGKKMGLQGEAIASFVAQAMRNDVERRREEE